MHEGDGAGIRSIGLLHDVSRKSPFQFPEKSAKRDASIAALRLSINVNKIVRSDRANEYLGGKKRYELKAPCTEAACNNGYPRNVPSCDFSNPPETRRITRAVALEPGGMKGADLRREMAFILSLRGAMRPLISLYFFTRVTYARNIFIRIRNAGAESNKRTKLL